MISAFNPPKHLDVKEYNRRATRIQSVVRGFLLRQTMEKLKRKCQSHASDWSKFVLQYKTLVRRIQVRHGIERPKTPFNLFEVNRFMDAKRSTSFYFLLYCANFGFISTIQDMNKPLISFNLMVKLNWDH